MYKKRMKKIVFMVILVLLFSTLSYSLEQDADRDGVPDAEDRCANTQTTIVDQFGCSCAQKSCTPDNNPCTDDCGSANGLAACNVPNNEPCDGGRCLRGACRSQIGASANSVELESPVALSDNVGNQRVLIIYVNLGSRAPEVLPDEARRQVFTLANDFYQKNSFNQVSLSGDLVGPYTLSGSLCRYDEVLEAAVQAADPSVNFNQYQKIIIYMPRTGGCDGAVTGGMGSVGKYGFNTQEGRIRATVAWVGRSGEPGISSNQFVVVKELAHNFGLGYATTVVDIRGDIFSITTGHAMHVNSIHKEAAGWLTKSVVATTGDYLLKPIERATDGIHQLKIPRADGSYYYLHFRQPLDEYDGNYLPSQIYSGVFVHRKYQFNEFEVRTIMENYVPTSNVWERYPLLQVGQEFNVGAYTVTLRSADSNGALVNVRPAGQAPPPQTPCGNGICDSGECNSCPGDCSGCLGPESLPSPNHKILFGYYFAEGRNGDFTSEVSDYTNLFAEFPSSYYTNETTNWKNDFRNALQRAFNSNRDIYLCAGCDEGLVNAGVIQERTIEEYYDYVLDAAAPYWSKVKFVEAGHEPDWDRATTEAKINTLKSKINSRGLSPKPIGITHSRGPILTTDSIFASNLDWVAIEAYVDPPGNSVSERNVENLNNLLTQAKARVPANKKIILIMQAYDRNGQWGNINTLKDLQKPVYMQSYNDQRVDAILMFSYGRGGGSRDHPELKVMHRKIGEKIMDTSGIPSAPSIRLVTPNEGEGVNSGSSYIVTWTSQNILSSQVITISLEDSSNRILGSSQNDGTETVTIPQVAAGSYYIVLTSNSNGEIISDRRRISITGHPPTGLSCQDSDNGRDYNIFGNVIVNGGNAVLDCCTNGGNDCVNGATHVREYFCNADSTLGSEVYRCPGTCSWGACVSTPLAPTLSINPSVVRPGENVQLSVSGASPNSNIYITVVNTAGQIINPYDNYPLEGRADNGGNFNYVIYGQTTQLWWAPKSYVAAVTINGIKSNNVNVNVVS